MPNNDGIEEATDLLVDKVFEVVQEKYPELVRMWKDPNTDLEGWTNTLVDILEDEFSFETKLMSKIVGEDDAIKEKNFVIHPVLFDHLEKTLQSAFKGETNRIDFSVETIFDDGVSMMIDVHEVEGEPSYAMATLYKGFSDVGVVSDLLNELERVWELLYEGVLYKVEVTRGG